MAAYLGEVDFPPYVVKCVDETHFLVAGGGGQARTGVPNAIEIFEIQKDGQHVIAKSTLRYETDTEDERSAVMNAALRYDGVSLEQYLMAAGKDEICQFYEITKRKVAVAPGGNANREEAQDDKDVNSKGAARRRKGKGGGDDTPKPNTNGKDKSQAQDAANNHTKAASKSTTQFAIKALGSVQTDFHEDDKYQKCVCWAPHGMFFVTGGADGHIRTWSYPSMEMMYDIEAHGKEVDDLIISPLGNRIVSMSRDSKASVWKASDGSHLCDLHWNGVKPESVKSYRFRSCRFGFINSDPSKNCMYTIHIPHVQGRKAQPCYITKWNPLTMTAEKTVSTGEDVLSALAISHNGHFMAVGSMSGAVGIFTTYNLQKLQWLKDVHGIFITGLSFVPMTRTTRALVGDLDTAVLSISADKRISVVGVDRQGEYPTFLMFFGALLLIIFIFVGLAAIGLEL